MEEKYEKVIINFNDILNMMLPVIEIEEDTEIICDVVALESHKINYDKENSNGEDVAVKISKGNYSHDYYNGIESGFFILTEEDGKLKIHTGVDVSYGKDSPISCMHPNIYTPVTGIVEEIDEAKGKVVIKDLGVIKVIGNIEHNVYYYHTVEHLDSISEYLEIGDKVYAGKSFLGKMGGRGVNGRYCYEQHVHYGIKIKGKYFTGSYEYEDTQEGIKNESEDLKKIYHLNPEMFWDEGHEMGFMEMDYLPEETKEEETKEEETKEEETKEEETKEEETKEEETKEEETKEEETKEEETKEEETNSIDFKNNEINYQNLKKDEEGAVILRRKYHGSSKK